MPLAQAQYRSLSTPYNVFVWSRGGGACVLDPFTSWLLYSTMENSVISLFRLIFFVIGTIFVYGSKLAGKKYTMGLGNPEESGIIPRAFSQIFQIISFFVVVVFICWLLQHAARYRYQQNYWLCYIVVVALYFVCLFVSFIFW